MESQPQMTSDLEQEAVANAIAYRNSRLKQRLEELGPGWAIGYRLKKQPYNPRQASHEPHRVDMEWETHEVQLVDGQVPAGLAGFHYASLPATPTVGG